MIGWLGVGVLLATAACASAAVAQLPISPVYRPGPEQAQPAPDKAAPAAKDRRRRRAASGRTRRPRNRKPANRSR